MRFRELSPGELAERALAAMHAPVNYKPVEPTAPRGLAREILAVMENRAWASLSGRPSFRRHAHAAPASARNCTAAVADIDIHACVHDARPRSRESSCRRQSSLNHLICSVGRVGHEARREELPIDGGVLPPAQPRQRDGRSRSLLTLRIVAHGFPLGVTPVEDEMRRSRAARPPPACWQAASEAAEAVAAGDPARAGRPR